MDINTIVSIVIGVFNVMAFVATGFLAVARMKASNETLRRELECVKEELKSMRLDIRELFRSHGSHAERIARVEAKQNGGRSD